MLEAGADPSAGDEDGTTCLHIAASLANTKLARLLTNSELGADANAPDKRGSTPLHLAVAPIQDARGALPPSPSQRPRHTQLGPSLADSDVIKCVKFLLGHGANPETKDHEGLRRRGTSQGLRMIPPLLLHPLVLSAASRCSLADPPTQPNRTRSRSCSPPRLRLTSSAQPVAAIRAGAGAATSRRPTRALGGAVRRTRTSRQEPPLAGGVGVGRARWHR